MATWKKVVVSGSNLSQLNDDIGLILNSDTGSIALGGELGGTISSATVADNIIDEANLKVSNSPTNGYILSANTGTGGFTWVANTSAANDTTITLSPGAGIAAIGDFTTNQASPETLTIGVDGVLEDLDTLGAAASDGQFIVATGAGAFAYESGDTVRTSLGLGNSATQDTGSMTVATADTATSADSVAANSVTLGTDTTGNYVATLGTGTGVTIGSNTGEGSTPTITVNYGSSANQAVQGNTNITINGTAGEIGVTGTAAQALGGGPTYTITLPDTITGNRTFSNNVTVSGDLTVSGDTFQAQVTNLNVEDQFILLNSGSTSGDSGIIFGGSNGTANSGHALILDNSYNSNDGRLAIKVTDTAATSTTDFAAGTTGYYVAGVYEGTEANAATALADHKGNIRIEGEDIYIYS